MVWSWHSVSPDPAPARLRALPAGAVITAITPSDWTARGWTGPPPSSTLQAMAGWARITRGTPKPPTIMAGGGFGEWVAGMFAGPSTARRQSMSTAEARHFSTCRCSSR